MPLKIGDVSVDKIYIGNTEITKEYVGESLLYGGSPPIETSVSIGTELTGTILAEADLGNAPPLDTSVSVDTELTGTVAVEADLGVTGIETSVSITGTIEGTVAATSNLGPPPLNTSVSIGTELTGTVAATPSLGTAPPLDTSISITGTIEGTVAATPNLGTAPPLDTSVSIDTGLTGTVAATPSLGTAPPLDTEVGIGTELTGTVVAEAELGSASPLDTSVSIDIELTGTLIPEPQIPAITLKDLDQDFKSFIPTRTFLPSVQGNTELFKDITTIIDVVEKNLYAKEIDTVIDSFNPRGESFDIDCLFNVIDNLGYGRGVFSDNIDNDPALAHIIPRMYELKGTQRGLELVLDLFGIGLEVFVGWRVLRDYRRYGNDGTMVGEFNNLFPSVDLDDIGNCDAYINITTLGNAFLNSYEGEQVDSIIAEIVRDFVWTCVNLNVFQKNSVSEEFALNEVDDTFAVLFEHELSETFNIVNSLEPSLNNSPLKFIGVVVSDSLSLVSIPKYDGTRTYDGTSIYGASGSGEGVNESISVTVS